MDEFTLKGKQGHIHIRLEELFNFPNTSHFGGYDAEATVEIKSGNYHVKGKLWFTTGEVYLFYEQLKNCYNSFQGEAVFATYEKNLELKAVFNRKGHVTLVGYYHEHLHLENKLIFEIESDQSYFESTLKQLEKFFQKYGGIKGKE